MSDEWLDEQFRMMVCGCVKAGFLPWRAMQLRQSLSTIETIERLVCLGENENGFAKLADLGHVELTCEAFVMERPTAFSLVVVAAARRRLEARAKQTKIAVGRLNAGRRSEFSTTDTRVSGTVKRR